MYILGLNFLSHDSAATLINNGKIMFACEEERLSREKHTKKFPVNSIIRCLENANITINQIDDIVLFVNPREHYKLALYNLVKGFPKSILYIPYSIKLMMKRYDMKNYIMKLNNINKEINVNYVNHHLAHAASAYYPSPYNKAAIITIDGRGEYETICIFKASGKRIEKVYSIKYPHSLGYLYSMVTKYLGFKPQSDEYKVMGLAPYGTDRLNSEMKDILSFDDKGLFRLNLKYFDHHYRYGKGRNGFTKAFIDKFGLPRKNNEPVTQHHADIAYALQDITEQVILSLARFAKNLTGESNLCIAGGVALNCSANYKLLSENIFDGIFIQPAANDAGASLGAALYYYHNNVNSDTGREYLNNAYLGPYSKEDCISVFEKFQKYVTYELLDNPCKKGAELIHKGNVIGWYQGRMEFGPRALGNRSIIAAPVNKDMKEIINAKIKFREEFRPFAPSVLEEEANNYFECFESGKELYKYMLAVTKVREDKADLIPAVVHQDNTSRIQTVYKEINPLYWKLIKEYHSISGIPLILNTSFNVKGQPIVFTIVDAINNFLDSDLDYVIIENYLIKKRNE